MGSSHPPVSKGADERTQARCRRRLLHPVHQGPRHRRGLGRDRPRGARPPPRRHGGRPRALVAGAALRHERRPARWRRGNRCGRTTARDGGARRDRQRRTTRPLVERQSLGRLGRRPGRRAGRRGGMGRCSRLCSGVVLHGFQAALDGRARAGVREADHRGPPPPRLVDRSVDRSESNGRPDGVRDHRPRRRVRHRLLVTPHWRVPPRPGPARARPRDRAAPRARTRRGRGNDRERRRRLGGDGRQHGRCTRAGHRPRRHRRLARHERDCLRGARSAVQRRFGDRRGFRRCHREVPAADRHVERRAGADHHCQHARHRSRRPGPTRPGQHSWCTRPVDASVSRRRTNPQPA